MSQSTTIPASVYVGLDVHKESIDIARQIGSIAQIGNARQFMGYLGLVPSENSSSHSVHRASITKTSNAHARHLLTEATWNYRFLARTSNELRTRSKACWHPYSRMDCAVALEFEVHGP